MFVTGHIANILLILLYYNKNLYLRHAQLLIPTNCVRCWGSVGWAWRHGHLRNHSPLVYALRFFRKMLTHQGTVLRRIVTDRLRSYGVAKRESLPSVAHCQDRYAWGMGSTRICRGLRKTLDIQKQKSSYWIQLLFLLASQNDLYIKNILRYHVLVMSNMSIWLRGVTG